VKTLRRNSSHHSAFVLLLGLIASAGLGYTQELRLKTKTSVGDGWHPWYEIKADPEGPTNLIICGTKWDAATNSPFGFVYASSDEGATWHSVLEDRNSAWVTEHSCAYGPKHRAYFISEASKVIDGIHQHKLGTTRLFVSTDSGWHWTETVKTGWADYSTSAFSSASGRLYTFFNFEPAYAETERQLGGSVGLVVFSSDGKEVAGPFISSAMQHLGYHGIFPSGAIALKSGSVVSLYYGKRSTPAGWEADLGVIRADQSQKPFLQPQVISHPVMDWTKGCFNYSDNSLAYNPEDNRLFLVYVDGCNEKQHLLLTSSVDEGRTWTKSVALADPRHLDLRVFSPSLVVSPSGMLGLLWEEGDNRHFGRWCFSYIVDSRLVSVTELSRRLDRNEVSNDSLRSSIDQTYRSDVTNPVGSSSITLLVLSELNVVWRGHGLIATGDKLLAIWPSGNRDGTRLNSAVLIRGDSGSNENGLTHPKASTDPDMTRQSIIFNVSEQHFDNSTGTLNVCLSLANRGDNSIKLPVTLEAKKIRSPIGSVSILNSANGLRTAGAIWTIDNSAAGGQILPGRSSSPFCLSFHLETAAKGVSSSEADELLILELKVLESNNENTDRDMGHQRSRQPFNYTHP
jgi:hypothetical protein